MGDLSTGEFEVVLVVFRVIFGFVFALHGWGKVKNGIGGTAGWFDSIGMKPGRLHAIAAASTEIGTGVLMMLGFLTSLAAAGMVGVMVVAGWTVHRHNGFMIVKDGWEYTFMVGLTAVLLAGLGPGGLSVDATLDIADELNGWVGLAVAVGLGVIAGVTQIVVFYRPPAR